MPSSHCLPRLVALTAVFLTTAAQAGSVGYEARFFGSNPNIPRLQLSNASDSASIVELVLTLHRDAYAFDYARQIGSTGTVRATLLDPDELQGEHRSPTIRYAFDAFDPGATFTFKTDVDPAHQNQRIDSRSVLFDFDGGSPADNVSLSVRFSDGTHLADLWPSFDPQLDGSVLFGQTMRPAPAAPLPPSPVAVPLPRGAWAGLGLFTIAGLAGVVRRRADLRD